MHIWVRTRYITDSFFLPCISSDEHLQNQTCFLRKEPFLFQMLGQTQNISQKNNNICNSFNCAIFPFDKSGHDEIIQNLEMVKKQN
mmetsp:Transcript_3732/g.6929  ORF Transcript_3732/g.6929 Transcript_3732/m.6929 type:complete len:86 (+) Transcript_3732:305-562(+)